jgi:hypothetical protein
MYPSSIIERVYGLKEKTVADMFLSAMGLTNDKVTATYLKEYKYGTQ